MCFWFCFEFSGFSMNIYKFKVNSERSGKNGLSLMFKFLCHRKSDRWVDQIITRCREMDQLLVSAEHPPEHKKWFAYLNMQIDCGILSLCSHISLKWQTELYNYHKLQSKCIIHLYVCCLQNHGSQYVPSRFFLLFRSNEILSRSYEMRSRSYDMRSFIIS